MTQLALTIVIALLIPQTSFASGGMDKAPNGPIQKVFFKSPQDGATVPQKFKVVFGVVGMKVKPAGSMDKDTGHHHLIINGTHVKMGEIVPADEKHIHFGKGETETEVELQPGEYTLTMQFADGSHISYGDKMATTIKITVK